MKLEDFDYHLPPGLIADKPKVNRSDSKLLLVPRSALPGEEADIERFRHAKVSDLSQFLSANDLLVINDTQVIKARLFGAKQTGGKVEVLIERVLSDSESLAFIKSSKSPKVGHFIEFKQGRAQIIERRDELFLLGWSLDQPLLAFLEAQGEVPLPPYIKRPAGPEDEHQYQTVYAAKPGAVAAPTAGLHFTNSLLEKIQNKGVQIGKITLHVGAGTFLPVRVEQVESHKMHAEYIEVTEALVEQVKRTKAAGGKVVAVGTTSVRALETAAQGGELKPFKGDSRIFIYPGFEFNVVDALLTNFHLPKSTLLMLVSAFADRSRMLAAYDSAIQNDYRFFSYGDAMLILPPERISQARDEGGDS